MSAVAMLAFRHAKMLHESIGQVRKYTGEPYYWHAWNVAVLVGEVESDPQVIAAAALHDVVEDVPGVTVDELRRPFGDFVAELVREMTHVYTHEAFPNLNRAKRKELEAERIRCTSPIARLIKTADNLDNIATIETADPDFAVTYKAEMRAYFDSLPENVLKRRLHAYLVSTPESEGPPRTSIVKPMAP